MTYKFEDLDFKRPLYVNTPFTFNGRAYQIGELFPWSKMAVGKHIVARMWNGRKLRHTIQGAYADAPTDPVVTDPVVTEDASTIAARLINTGAGWYNVEVDGLGVVNPKKLKGREEAEAWAVENNYSIVVDIAPTDV